VLLCVTLCVYCLPSSVNKKLLQVNTVKSKEVKNIYNVIEIYKMTKHF